jgi:hypothetical protein
MSLILTGGALGILHKKKKWVFWILFILDIFYSISWNQSIADSNDVAALK